MLFGIFPYRPSESGVKRFQTAFLCLVRALSQIAAAPVFQTAFAVNLWL
ncbi:hypothetical protein HMPREF9120_01136 [Neisseria sp. oral taxon 020 str. F0370]|nr:hypothetical protein HMPREF9120_01136 [Neisseria sp. oral taxon 020 str. F0370]